MRSVSTTLKKSRSKFEMHMVKLKRQIQHELCHKKTKAKNYTIHTWICLFCFATCNSNLDPKFLGL